jgi:hypothetical protein
MVFSHNSYLRIQTKYFSEHWQLQKWYESTQTSYHFLDFIFIVEATFQLWKVATVPQR